MGVAVACRAAGHILYTDWERYVVLFQQVIATIVQELWNECRFDASCMLSAMRVSVQMPGSVQDIRLKRMHSWERRNIALSRILPGMTDGVGLPV